jgi:hypothetical protein
MPKLMREWTENLTIRQQAVLVSAVRGCDGAPKDDPSKSILWALRWDILHPSEDGRRSPQNTVVHGLYGDLDCGS